MWRAALLRTKIAPWLTGVVCVCAVAGCSLEAKKGRGVTLQLPDERTLQAASQAIEAKLNPNSDRAILNRLGVMSGGPSSVPALDQLNCFAVNVWSLGTTADIPKHKQFQAIEGCGSFEGALPVGENLAGSVGKGGAVQVEVTAGERIFQLVGWRQGSDEPTCADINTLVASAPSSFANKSEVYEIARLAATISGNADLSFTIDYDPTKPKPVTCLFNRGDAAVTATSEVVTPTEDTSFNGQLKSSTSTIIYPGLAYELVTEPSHGDVTALDSSTGAYTYVPDANFNGIDTLTFRVWNGSIASNLGTVTLSVVPVNDAPTLTTISTLSGGTEDTQLTIAYADLANAADESDIDPDTLSFRVASVLSGVLKKSGVPVVAGTTTLATGESLTWDPPADQNGPLSAFQITAFDGTAASASALTAVVAVSAVNDAPVAASGTLGTTEDTATTGTLVGSDTENASLTYSIVSQGSKGTATITQSGTGAFTFTPNSNATGNDTFTFKVNDGSLDSPTASIIVTITAVNDAPVANTTTLNTTEDTAASTPLSGSDVEGSTLTYSLVSQGSRGIASVSANGTLTYTPNANATGSDTLTFKVNDGTVDSSAASVTVNISATNDSPVANAGTLTVTEDTASSGTLTGSDLESSVTYAVVSQGTRGTVVINDASTGAYTYTPSANQTGTDSFAFKVNDGTVDSGPATINVTINAVNDAPVANAGNLTATEDGGATNGTLTGSDIEGSGLTYSIVSQGGHGTVSITDSATGAYTYTPTANYNGADSFTFKVNDGALDSATASITVSIAAVNDAPVASADSISTSEDTLVSGTLAGSDPDGDALSFQIVSGAGLGVATITNSATGAYTYSPSANVSGSDSFTYRISDGTTYSTTETVSVTISAINDAPVAGSDSFSVAENGSHNGSVVATDVDSGSLTYSVVDPPTKGTFSLNSNGTYNYTANTLMVGSDSFTFKANDGTSNSNTATVSIDITYTPPTQLYIQSIGSGPVAGDCAPSPITIEVRNASNALQHVYASTVVALSTDHGGTFHTQNNCLDTAISQITFAPGEDFKTVYFRSTYAGVQDITASQPQSSLSSYTRTITYYHGLASQLQFITQPGNAQAGVNLSQQPVVRVADAYGNAITSGADSSVNVVMSVTDGSGIYGTATVGASNGVASFTNLSLHFPTGSKSFTATASTTQGSLSSVSNSFSLSAGAVYPGNCTLTSGAALANGSDPVVVTLTLRDSYYNPISGKQAAISSSRGGTDSIVPATATTSTTGTAQFSLTSPTRGKSTLTGNDVTDGVPFTPIPASYADFRGIGDPDPAFGTLGIAEIWPSGQSAHVQGLALEAGIGGRIILGGWIKQCCSIPNYVDHFGVGRLLASGAVDNSFGSNGYKDFPELETGSASTSYSQGHAVTVLSDGKAVLAGFARENSSSTAATRDIAVLQVNSSGSLDPGFGTSGFTVFDQGTVANIATSIAIQTINGPENLIVAGYSTGNGKPIFLKRITPSGALDGSFTPPSITLSSNQDRLNAVAVDPVDQSVVAVGGVEVGLATASAAIIRRTPTGASATAFNSGGSPLLTSLGAAMGAEALALAIHPTNQKIVVVGRYDMAAGNSKWFVARFDSNGVLDATFGTSGVYTIDFSAGMDVARAVAIDSVTGQILVAGSRDEASAVGQTVVIRLGNAGNLDTSFADNGISTIDVVYASADWATGIALQPLTAGGSRTLVTIGGAPGSSSTTFRVVGLMNN